MRKNEKEKSLAEIGNVLSSADSILIFPHIQIDGDALGSSVALCGAFRKRGKKADIIIEDKIPENIKFLDKGYCVWDTDITKPDVCIAVDCSDISRIVKRRDIFNGCKRTVSIDHHATAVPFADLNYLDDGASSTGEIILRLLKAMKWSIESDIAEAIYTAIVTDTGRFMYSNTSGKTHRIVAELLDTGMDHNKVSVEVYQRNRLERIRLINSIMSTLEIASHGRCSLAIMTEQMLMDTGAYVEETEGVVEELRSIDGVEISAFLKQEKDNVKVTLRSKTEADVSKIAMQFNGGGHKRAAGCTISGDINEVKLLIMQSIQKELNDMGN
ncbi:MAG TPA: bifunctional oligoribonuclease/PAP phosphatase NrnA [Anaerovoracaceae bacterium]|nr:bifunctional oligoribonuclease/PAP phosphatase NrnA [Anaerovoracaceae bacterium]